MSDTIEFPRRVSGVTLEGKPIVESTQVSTKNISDLLASMLTLPMVAPAVKTGMSLEDSSESLLPFRFSASPLLGIECHVAFTKIGGLLGLYDSLIANKVQVFLFHTFQYVKDRNIVLVWLNLPGQKPSLYLVEVDVDKMFKGVHVKQYKEAGKVPPEVMSNELAEKWERGVYQGDYMDELETYNNRLWLMSQTIPITLLEIITNNPLTYM